jgi:hypothetical protein
MERFRVSSHQATVALQALRTTALADGALEGHEHALLLAAARALGVPPPEAGTTPGAVAAEIPDAGARTRLVQAMLTMALLDGAVDEREITCIASFATALGVDEPRLGNLRHIAQGRLRLLQLDLLRRSPMARMAEQVWRERGLGETWRYLASPQGWSHDEALAARFHALEHYPAGSFGRVYWAHMTRRAFPFPGEHKAFPEELVRHDLSHVLSGYDTDVAGEVENAAFLSGCLREDPFSYWFMLAVHVHLDIEIFPNDPSQAFLGIDPARAIAALERGMRVKRDLYDLGWDYWQDLPRPIAVVRAEFGIDPPGRPDPA